MDFRGRRIGGRAARRGAKGATSEILEFNAHDLQNLCIDEIDAHRHRCRDPGHDPERQFPFDKNGESGKKDERRWH